MYQQARRYCREYLRERIKQSQYFGTSHAWPTTRLNILFCPLTEFQTGHMSRRNLHVGKNEIVLSVHTDQHLQFDYPRFLDFRFVPGDMHKSQFFLSESSKVRAKRRDYWQNLVTKRDFHEFCDDIVEKLETILEIYPQKRDLFWHQLNWQSNTLASKTYSTESKTD
ncbi:MAG: hypothetical protein ACMXYF_02395 [Candidatus Woesearchaeota archaeon]